MYKKDCPKMKSRPAEFVDYDKVGKTKFYGNGCMNGKAKKMSTCQPSWIPNANMEYC